MGQTVVTAAFEVQPAGAALLEGCITSFRQQQEPASGESYAALKHAVPTLHFMSIMVIRDATYDPLFLLEVNFDGDAEAFWRSLVAAIGDDLTAMLRFCQPPRGAAAARFAAALTRREELAGALAEASVRPTAFHLGNRGLTRAQIADESALFDRVQTELAAADPAYRSQTPAGIHRTLRAAVAGEFGWLDQPSPPRVPSGENRADWINLAVFFGAVLAVLAVPGAIVALALPWWFTAAIGAAAAVALRGRVPDLSRIVPTGRVQAILWAAIAVMSAVCGAAWLGAAAFGLYLLDCLAALLQRAPTPDLGAWMAGALLCVAAGAACAPAVILIVLAWLRRLELNDPTSTGPVLDERVAREMAELEDQTSVVYQNHMGSLVQVKPGGLRSLLLRVGHHALFLALRVVARDGYLSDMRTVHFAHWALMNNSSRLLFMSNFDGTWSSYLDDFIEKAHGGTTLAWTNCVGSPLAAFLWLDGVTSGRQFKQWARCSMAPNLFWFSAYPTLTVNQIERNHLVAEGLRQPALDPGRAAQWIRSL